MTKKLALLCLSENIFSEMKDAADFIAQRAEETLKETVPNYLIWNPKEVSNEVALKNVVVNVLIGMFPFMESGEQVVVSPISKNFTFCEKLAEVGSATSSVLVVATPPTVKQALDKLIALEDPQHHTRIDTPDIKSGVAIILEPQYPRFAWCDLRTGSTKNQKHFQVAKYIV